MELVLTKNFGERDVRRIDAAVKAGAYDSLKKLFLMRPEEVTAQVLASGLRGRGGAGFPTGRKWQFVPKDHQPVYLCVNADEGEPGTFKDRALIERDPHSLIEGMVIASYAIGAHRSFIYFRGEFFNPFEIFSAALAEAKERGFVGKNISGSGFDLEIETYRGAGAYICGEETSLLSSLEGGRGYPRIRPPFPAVSGLWWQPTVVNNVETVSALPFIISRGAETYAKYGTENSRGTKLISVSGHIKRPGVYEIPLGMPLVGFLREYAGGVWNERALKAVIVGGSSVPVITAAEAENVNLDYESCQSAGTMLGSGGMIVMDETTCMVKALLRLARFYHHESCGQCVPCREGSGWIHGILERIKDGLGVAGDIDRLVNIADNMVGRTICVFADALQMPVRSFVTKFRSEFEEHLRTGSCAVCDANAKDNH